MSFMGCLHILEDECRINMCTCKSHLRTFMLYPSSFSLVEGPLFERAFEMPTLWCATSDYAREKKIDSKAEATKPMYYL